MSIQWKDVSSYSQGQKNRAPNCYEVRVGRWVRAVVVHNHIHYRDRWTGRVMPFDSDPVVGTDGEPMSEADVKTMTLQRAREIVEALSAALR